MPWAASYRLWLRAQSQPRRRRRLHLCAAFAGLTDLIAIATQTCPSSVSRATSSARTSKPRWPSALAASGRFRV